MTFPANRQRHNQKHERPGTPRSRRSLWRRISLPLLLAALISLIAACAPAPQTPAAPSVATPSASKQTFTYVAIGASDSFGIGTDNPTQDNWPTVLAGLMGPDVHLINLGIPGETVAEARETELPVALDAKPNIVTVWLGVNDILQSVPVDEYEQGLEAILHALDEHTHAHVFVGNIPDLTALPYFAGYDQDALKAKIAHWNTAVDQAVAATGAILVDINASWDIVTQHPEYVASDGLHPSTAGAKQLAAVFLSWILIALPDIHKEAGAA
jgi:lysophospholipase L1-like esterase